MERSAHPPSNSETDLVAWLHFAASRTSDPAGLLTGLCERLVAGGLELAQAALELATLHPLMAASIYQWRPGPAPALELPLFHGPLNGAAGGHAPSQILAGRSHRLVALPAEGLTAHAAWSLTFSDGSQHALAFATERPGGFTADQLALLAEVVRAAAAPLEILALKQMTATLVTTYLGRRTGQRVLTGAIRRGDGDSVEAVLWYSDLRGFTALSQRLPRDRIIDLLNAHFERLAAPIKAFGGEVLKFIGDGLLAIFPIADAGSAERACQQALKAARAAHAGMAGLNGERQAAGEPPLQFGLALHLGEVMYGNIGAPDRLDFTVIGPTVNLASRLEGLCKVLDRPVLASAAFARHCPERLQPCGSHVLAGIPAPVAAFTLAEFARDRRV